MHPKILAKQLHKLYNEKEKIRTLSKSFKYIIYETKRGVNL